MHNAPKNPLAAISRPFFIPVLLGMMTTSALSQDVDDSALLDDILGQSTEIVEEGSSDGDDPQNPLRFRIESSATAFDRRTANPSPPSAASNWALRTRMVGEGTFILGDELSFRLNSALTINHDDRAVFDADEDVNLAVREAYFLWQSGQASLQFGRINIRNGSAIGFNPVDFFRIQDADERTNLDPTEARQNRLGVLAAQFGWDWDNGSVGLTYAPEITGGSDIFHDEPIFGLNLSSTNPSERILLTATYAIADGFSPEAYILWDDGDLKYGLAGSVSIGDQWILYGEWAGGNRRNLIDTALFDDRESDRLDPIITSFLGADAGKQHQNEVALGFSYSTASNIVTNLEYHYNSRGLSSADWDSYFAAAAAAAGNPRASGQLANIPLTAALGLEPASMHSLFWRTAFNDVVDDLTLTTIANVSMADWSASLQIQGDYDLNDTTTLYGRIGGNFGPAESDFGSRSNAAFAEIGVRMHF